MKAALSIGGIETELEVKQLEPGIAVLSLPPGLEPGSYDLRLSNAASPAADPEAAPGSKDERVQNALTISTPPPAAVETPQAQEAPSAAAEAPPAQASVPEPEPEPAPEPVPAPATEPTATPTAPGAAPETPASAVGAKKGKRPGLPLDLGVGWESCFVLGGSWQALYPLTAAVAEARARLGLWTFGAAGQGGQWQLGAELRGRAALFAFDGDSGTYEESSMAAYGAELGPCLTVPILAARLSLSLDGGLAYSVASKSASSSSLGSLDPAVSSSLALSFSPAAHLELGAFVSFRYVFYLGSAMPSASAGAVVSYRP